MNIDSFISVYISAVSLIAGSLLSLLMLTFSSDGAGINTTDMLVVYALIGGPTVSLVLACFGRKFSKSVNEFDLKKSQILIKLSVATLITTILFLFFLSNI